VGEPVSIFYDYEADGCWGVGEYDNMWLTCCKASPSLHGHQLWLAGTVKIVDQNGDGVIDEDNDRVTFQRTPKHIFGLTNNFSYKGLP
jgi:hypothetical protein